MEDLYDSNIATTYQALNYKQQSNSSLYRNVYPHLAFAAEQAESSCLDIITMGLSITYLFNISFDSTGITQCYYF